MAIQMRRGNAINYDPSKLVAGEFAVSQDNQRVYLCIAQGNVVELLTDRPIEEWVEESEAWAVGERGGEPVESTDETYHNNSKYYSEQSDSLGRAQAENSEAWAVGERDGEPVTSGDDTYHNNSKYYSTQADTRAEDSEAYAIGKRDGTDVPSGDVAYHNNSKYYSEQANNLGAAQVENAEAWALGTRNGTAVPSTDDAYENNSKYYAEVVALGNSLDSEAYAVGTRNGTAVSSGDAAYHNNSKYYAETTAKGNAEDSEAWAVGERNGTPVPVTDPTSNNNAKYWAGQAQSYAAGGIHFIGSVAFANIPTQDVSAGDMYNITDDFTTDARFVEGAGIFVPAGTDIIYDANGLWDLYSPAGVVTFNGRRGAVTPTSGDYNLSQLGDCSITGTVSNGQILIRRSGAWKNSRLYNEVVIDTQQAQTVYTINAPTGSDIYYDVYTDTYGDSPSDIRTPQSDVVEIEFDEAKVRTIIFKFWSM